MHTTFVIQSGVEISAAVALLLGALAFILGAMVYAIAHRRFVDMSTGPGKAVLAICVPMAIIGVAWSIANLAV